MNSLVGQSLATQFSHEKYDLSGPCFDPEFTDIRDLSGRRLYQEGSV